MGWRVYPGPYMAIMGQIGPYGLHIWPSGLHIGSIWAPSGLIGGLPGYPGTLAATPSPYYPGYLAATPSPYS